MPELPTLSAVRPAAALTCNAVAPEHCAPIGKIPEAEEMLHLIRQRRSIRQFKDESIDPRILEKLLLSSADSREICFWGFDNRLFFLYNSALQLQ